MSSDENLWMVTWYFDDGAEREFGPIHVSSLATQLYALGVSEKTKFQLGINGVSVRSYEMWKKDKELKNRA